MTELWTQQYAHCHVIVMPIWIFIGAVIKIMLRGFSLLNTYNFYTVCVIMCVGLATNPLNFLTRAMNQSQSHIQTDIFSDKFLEEIQKFMWNWKQKGLACSFCVSPAMMILISSTFLEKKICFFLKIKVNVSA